MKSKSDIIGEAWEAAFTPERKGAYVAAEVEGSESAWILNIFGTLLTTSL